MVALVAVVEFPVKAPTKVVAVTVPATCNFVDGAAVPMPTLFVVLSIVKTLVPTCPVPSKALVLLISKLPLPASLLKIDQ